ncbi:MAG: hypothetical protein CM1200mP16_06130 [Nitrospina sp.]|nr:MAG: hypothetical protein CM1200mP16_06130 [Nitrospina sp.]
MIRNKNNSIKKKIFPCFFWRCSWDSFSSKGIAATIVPEKMVLINAGGFSRGINKTGTKLLLMKPRLKIFIYLPTNDKFEISNAEYTEFIKATDHPAPAYWDHHQLNQPSQPGTGVNWYDANTYCHWANKRLPRKLNGKKLHGGQTRF